MKKGLALLLSMAVTVGAFVSCGNESTNKDKNTENGTTTNQNDKKDEDKTSSVDQEIVFNLGSDPKYLDPGLNSASDGGDIINNLFEGLVREDENGVIQPAMAESWEISDDYLTYTFKIRDAKWSDGTAITANDFEYSWKRVLNPETKSQYSFIMYMIENAEAYNTEKATADQVGVKAIDEKTLQVKLKSPTGYFLGVTAFYSFFPVSEKAVGDTEEGTWAKDGAAFVGNGPFKLDSYTSGDKMILVKNENYWRASEIKLNKIETLMINEASTAYTAYKNKDIDVIDSMPSELIPKLMVEDPEFYVIPQLGTYYYSFNLRDDAPAVFKDAKVRKALSYAINRKDIVELVTKGGQMPATGFTPPGIMDAKNKDFRGTAGDYGMPIAGEKIDEAKKLLADAGFPNGDGFPEIVLKYNTSEGHKKVAEAVQEMWKKNLNISITLDNSEWAVFQDQKRKGQFEIARGGWIGDYADPNTMLDLFVNGASHNDGKWVSDEYTKLVKEASTMVGEARMEKLYKADALLAEEAPIIPVYYYTDQYMVATNVEGVRKTSLNTFYFGYTTVK